ncbi:ATP synthase epsilon chain, chloroplastic [Vitis vinifera]|uniref:ATP synthase epsilon chain, chloroplastic n=1 Tax=Vitis vinifera TaxID=29760 RepID=A0A438JM92_VITVI|nr:ATP synthase epsilon chain, chloroplastic [Vitis vinifera]
MGWAPQMEILARPSIGGSLLHSGWGSVIETLQFGHCPIVLPFVIDQGLNARLLVEKGEKLRIRAREAAMIFGDQNLHQSYIDELVKVLDSHECSLGLEQTISIQLIIVLINDAEKGSVIEPQEAQQTLEIVEANLRKAGGKRQIIEANLTFKQARTRVEAINVTS